MKLSVAYPFIPYPRMARQAYQLLTSFYKIPLEQIPLPIDVDAIIQSLGYGLEFGNMKQYGYDDTLGFISFEKNEVWVDTTLDPIENPEMEGRFNHTIAHETGHHILHKPLVEAYNMQRKLFESPEVGILCRTSEEREPQEKQADYFASALLMPEGHVRKYFQQVMADLGLACEDRNFEYAVSKAMMEIFKVSRQSMLIRLNELKMFHNLQSNQLILT